MSCAINDMAIIEQLTPARLTPLAGFLGGARLWVLDTNLAIHTLDWLFERQGDHAIFVDTVSVAKVEKIRPWLGKIHTLKPNRSEAEQLCGMTIAGPETWPMVAAWFHRAGVKRLFLSLGDRGSSTAMASSRATCRCWAVRYSTSPAAGMPLWLASPTPGCKSSTLPKPPALPWAAPPSPSIVPIPFFPV